MKRIGGLVISRKVGEEITLLFQVERINRKLKLEMLNPEGSCTVSIDNKRYELYPGDSIGIGDGAVYLEEILGGRAALRLILNDSVRILRSELLN